MVAENSSFALEALLHVPRETVVILGNFNIFQIYCEITYLYVIYRDWIEKHLVQERGDMAF